MRSGDLILPNNHKKYPASISYSENVRCKKKYRAFFNLYEPDPISKKLKVHGTFMTYEDAFDFVKEQSTIDCNNRVKNVITKVDDYYECELTQGQAMLFDFLDIDLVQNFTWRSGATGIAMTNYDDSLVSCCFHKCILGKLEEGYEILHVNGNKYDNRRQNLKIVRKHGKLPSNKKVSKKYQQINKFNLLDNQINNEIVEDKYEELFNIDNLDIYQL